MGSSSLPRDQIQAPCIGSGVLATGPEKSPNQILRKSRLMAQMSYLHIYSVGRCTRNKNMYFFNYYLTGNVLPEFAFLLSQSQVFFPTTETPAKSAALSSYLTHLQHVTLRTCFLKCCPRGLQAASPLVFHHNHSVGSSC